MSALQILVTGANGFVGQSLCQRLIKAGHAVFGLGRGEPRVHGFRDFYRFDITKPFAIEQNFDAVVHLAAYNVTHIGDQNADLYHSVNVQGTENVIKAVKTRRFVFLSSAKVYLSQGKPISEDSPVLPLKEYEKSKLAAEQVCRTLIGERDLLIFRCVNIVGPEQPEKAIIPVLFQKAKAGETLEIFGPRASVLQLLYIEDAIDAMINAIENPHVFGIYNLASSEHIRLDVLAEYIKRMTGSQSQIHCSNNDPAVFSDILCAKAEKAFQWKAKVSIQMILESYLS